MNIFFIEYKYDDFIHVSMDEFMQLHLCLQCTPIVCSHVVILKCDTWHQLDFSK